MNRLIIFIIIFAGILIIGAAYSVYNQGILGEFQPRYPPPSLGFKYSLSDIQGIVSSSLSLQEAFARCPPPYESCEAPSPPELVDLAGNPVTDIVPGQLVLIQNEIGNGQNKKQPFAYIVQIKDQYDIIISVSWITGELLELQSLKVSRSWTPDSAGDFTVEIFFWEGVNNPNPLGPTEQTTVTVSPLVRILEGSANPEQKENYSPKVIKVVLGINNTVVWSNEDSVAHSVKGDRGEFDSGLLGPNETRSHTFTKAGIYGYHSVSGPWLRGTVIVHLLPEEEKALAASVCLDKQYAIKHPDVIKYVKSALFAQCAVHSEFIDGGKVERITIHTTGGQTAKGHWSTGYTVSYIDKKDIIVNVDSVTRKFLNMSVVEVPDESYNFGTNDDIQKILRFALQDDLARKFLESDDYYVRNIRYPGLGLGTCYTEPCGSVVIDRTNSRISVVIEVNVFKDYPISVSTGFLQLAKLKIITANDDPEPIPTLSATRGQTLDIPLRIVGQPSAKNDTVPLKLEASMTAFQDYRRYYDQQAQSMLEEVFEYRFSPSEIEIRSTTDMIVNLSVSVPDHLEKGMYILEISGSYEDKSGLCKDKCGGTIVYLNVD